jgi:hypothetical protein
MNNLLFAISTLLSLLGSGILAQLYLLPWLRRVIRNDALSFLVSPHVLFRLIGLSFLVRGVVSPEVPAAFAVPAAYGDLVADVIAIVTIVALSKGASWAIASVWVFNVWGTADLLFAGYQGLRVHMDPGMLGAAFFIPTAIVPPLLVTHGLIFWLLVRPDEI